MADNEDARSWSNPQQVFLLLGAVFLLLPILAACTDTTTPSPTATPIIIVVTATPEPVRDTPSPTAMSLPSPTATIVPVFQSGGLGLTEQEWRSIGVANLPKALSIKTNLADRRVSDISLVYWEMGIEDGDWVPVTQARSDSKKLLPKDAVLVSEGLTYEHMFYIVTVDTYTSSSLISVFESAGNVWRGAQQGTFNVEYFVSGPGNNAGASSMQVSLGKRGPILTDFGIDPDVANEFMTSGVYSDAVVNDNDVKLRSGPGLNYDSGTKLNKGVRLTIMGKDRTGEWLQVAVIEQNFGWMMAKYLKVNIVLADVPIAEIPPTPKPQEVAVNFSGNGSLKTKSFQAAGGHYTIDWTATDAIVGGIGCFHNIVLKSVEATDWLEAFGSGPDAGGAKYGSTEVYNLKPGKYYFHVFSGCDWTISISPQE